MIPMIWVEIATGFMGAMTLVFLWRAALRRLGLMPLVTAHFSPKGGCAAAIVQELKKARREILVLAYSFTSEAITNALVDAKKRGVHVDIVLDKSNEVERYSDLRLFLDHGLAPTVDHNHAIAHNKVMVIDGKTLVTGSYNFTKQAEEENAENMLIFKGHPELVRLYRQNFLAHKGHSKPGQIKQPVETHAAARKAA